MAASYEWLQVSNLRGTLTRPDPYGGRVHVEVYGCSSCGALVSVDDLETHEAWHEEPR